MAAQLPPILWHTAVDRGVSTPRVLAHRTAFSVLWPQHRADALDAYTILSQDGVLRQIVGRLRRLLVARRRSLVAKKAAVRSLRSCEKIDRSFGFRKREPHALAVASYCASTAGALFGCSGARKGPGQADFRLRPPGFIPALL